MQFGGEPRTCKCAHIKSVCVCEEGRGGGYLRVRRQSKSVSAAWRTTSDAITAAAVIMRSFMMSKVQTISASKQRALHKRRQEQERAGEAEERSVRGGREYYMAD
eukprot:COSAG05_NODE_2557_length_2908_cov_14.229975_4_plen_105_part_00